MEKRKSHTGKYTRYVSQRNLALKRRRDKEDVRRLEKRLAALERIVHGLVIGKTSENLEAYPHPGIVPKGNIRDDLKVLDRIAKTGSNYPQEGSKQD